MKNPITGTPTSNSGGLVHPGVPLVSSDIAARRSGNVIASEASPTQDKFLRTMHDLGEVPENAAIESNVGATVLTPQSPSTMLMRLRAEFPFVPIMPFPSAFVTAVLAANVAQDMNFPDGTALFILTGNSDYYVSMNEVAKIPTAALQGQSGSIFKPEWSWFWTQNKQISVISPNAGTIVQACCYIPRGIPEYR